MFLGDIFSFGWGEVFFSGRKGGKGRHKSTIIIRVKGQRSCNECVIWSL